MTLNTSAIWVVMFIPLYSLFNYVRAVTGSLKIMLISIIVMCSKEQCLICSSKFHRCCVIMEITTKKNIKPEAYKNAALTWLPNVKTHEFQACDLKSILKQNPRKELLLSFTYNTHKICIKETQNWVLIFMILWLMNTSSEYILGCFFNYGTLISQGLIFC